MKHCQSIKPQGRENKQGLPTCQATNLYFEPCWSLSKWGYWAKSSGSSYCILRHESFLRKSPCFFKSLYKSVGGMMLNSAKNNQLRILVKSRESHMIDDILQGNEHVN